MCVARHDLCLERELFGRFGQGFDRHSIRHAVHLKEHAAGPDLDLVALRVALALAELYLRRLLGKWLVGEDAHPLLAGLAQRAGDDLAGGLYLVGAHARGRGGFEPVAAKGHRHAPAGEFDDLGVLAHRVRLAEFYFFRKQHKNYLVFSALEKMSPLYIHTLLPSTPSGRLARSRWNSTSARMVCRGTRPFLSVSVRDIEPPPSMPESVMRTPLTSRLAITFSIVCLSTRRKGKRFSNPSATM